MNVGVSKCNLAAKESRGVLELHRGNIRSDSPYLRSKRMRLKIKEIHKLYF